MASLPLGLTVDTFLTITVVVHSLLAAATFVHARTADRPANRWTAAVLVTGVLGVAAYVLTDD